MFIGRKKELSQLDRLYFSKTGFTKGCTDKAEELGNVILVTYEEILKA